MKEVRKKSIDPATNAMLVKADRQKIELAWDRAEAMQPQCGFGRMNICCSDCNQGPCRINPFAATDQRTICGRTQEDLGSRHFLRRVMDGAAALVNLADDFDARIDRGIYKAVFNSCDNMLLPSDYSSRLQGVGNSVAQLLAAISAVKEQTYEKTGPSMTAVNLGTLKADAVNILLLGHMAPEKIRQLADAAAGNAVPVNITTMCGSETGGPLNLPILTNLVSQEMPLMTEAIDLLVTGSQCVMPAVLTLAETLNVPVAGDQILNSSALITETLQTATSAFHRRAGKQVRIPACTAQASLGYTAENSKELLGSLNAGYLKGAVRGLAYLGGCGNIAGTQDAQFIKLAAGLLADDYLVVTAGCAGTALAKAGLCRPESAAGSGLKSVLPAAVPPVLNIGSCHDAGIFLQMAQTVAESGMPVFAVMAETTHNKVLATAIAFAAEGIKVYLDEGEAATVPEFSLKGEIRPLAEFDKQSRVPVAAA